MTSATAVEARPQYILGITRAASPPAVTRPGVGGAQVRAVVEGELAALVSDLPDGADVAVSRDDLMAHAGVLEEALAQGTVLPMRFGMALPSEDAVREELLKPHATELLAQLEALEGCVEISVKATYEEEALMAEVLAEQPAVRELRDAIAGRPEDATYFERVRLGELVAGAVEAKRTADTEHVGRRLAELAEAVELGEPVHERMAVNAAFLVERDRVAAFDREVEAVAAEQAGRLRVRLAGPLPPYSFVDAPGEA